MNPVVHPFPQKKQRCGRSRRGRQSVGSKVCPTESAAMNSSAIYYQPGPCSEPEVERLQTVQIYGRAPEGCSRQSCWKRCLKHTRVSLFGRHLHSWIHATTTGSFDAADRRRLDAYVPASTSTCATYSAQHHWSSQWGDLGRETPLSRSWNASLAHALPCRT